MFDSKLEAGSQKTPDGLISENLFVIIQASVSHQEIKSVSVSHRDTKSNISVKRRPDGEGSSHIKLNLASPVSQGGRHATRHSFITENKTFFLGIIIRGIHSGSRWRIHRPHTFTNENCICTSEDKKRMHNAELAIQAVTYFWINKQGDEKRQVSSSKVSFRDQTRMKSYLSHILCVWSHVFF